MPPPRPTDDGVVSSILRGHVVGNVPDDARSHISGSPDTGETVRRPTAKLLAKADWALTADLIPHSRTLLQGMMRDSEYQHDKKKIPRCPRPLVLVRQSK